MLGCTPESRGGYTDHMLRRAHEALRNLGRHWAEGPWRYVVSFTVFLAGWTLISIWPFGYTGQHALAGGVVAAAIFTALNAWMDRRRRK